jgi:hypothetical protein
MYIRNLQLILKVALYATCLILEVMEILLQSIAGVHYDGKIGDMSSDTAHRHDYRWWHEAVPAEPAHPHPCDFFGGGRMLLLTTQKHDYTTKPVTRIVNFRPYNNIRLSGSPMEDTTVSSASCQPIENCRPAESFKLQSPYNAPSTPFAKDMVHTLSYMPPPETEKVRGYKKENY